MGFSKVVKKMGSEEGETLVEMPEFDLNCNDLGDAITDLENEQSKNESSRPRQAKRESSESSDEEFEVDHENAFQSKLDKRKASKARRMKHWASKRRRQWGVRVANPASGIAFTGLGGHSNFADFGGSVWNSSSGGCDFGGGGCDFGGCDISF
jgi:hypothetical protein